MPRKCSLKTQRRRAWEAFSKYIRMKHAVDGYVRCVTCGTTIPWQDAHAGHFVHGLTVQGTDDGFEMIEHNVHPQCNHCNTFNAQHAMIAYTTFMLDTYGRECIEELQALRHKPVKLRLDDWKQLETYYADRITDLDDDAATVISLRRRKEE